jgi:hypothetical protein
MFEEAAMMSASQLLSVAYYTRIALEHLFTPEDLRKYPLLEGSSAPTPEEEEVACRWLAEIEKKENRLIHQLDGKTIRHYIGQIVDMSLRRSEEERGPFDPERAERLLENLRRAVPLPSDRLRKAG